MRIQWLKRRWPSAKVKDQGQIVLKMGKKTKQLAISWIIFHLQTSVQTNSAHSMIQLPMIFRSRSKVKVKFSSKWIKNYTTGHISDAISHTDFILGTKLQPIKRIQWPKCRCRMTFGQGQRARSKVLKKRKTKLLAIFPMLFRFHRHHTWYQGITHLGAINDPSADDLDHRSK